MSEYIKPDDTRMSIKDPQPMDVMPDTWVTLTWLGDDTIIQETSWHANANVLQPTDVMADTGMHFPYDTANHLHLTTVTLVVSTTWREEVRQV